MKVSKLILYSLLLALNLYPQAGTAKLIDWPKKSDAKLVNEYIQFLESHSKRICPANERKKLNTLYKEYRSAGQYLPLTDKQELDVETIKKNLGLIERKKDWVIGLRTSLKKQSQYPKLTVGDPLRKNLKELMELKRDYVAARDSNAKKRIQKASKAKLNEFQKSYDKLTKQIPFLLSFEYPLDHLKNRGDYEGAIASGEWRKSNDIYFKRKIYEDGMPRPGGRLTDIYERTTFDSVKIRLMQNKSDFLPDDIRYDLEWLLARMDQVLKRGKPYMMAQLQEWADQIALSSEFYKGITAPPEPNRSPSQVASLHAEASRNLSNFVRTKHAQIYEALTKQPEWIQALYVMDQVLLNEVGRATNENYRDRRDISQIVINRHSHSRYSSIEAKEKLQSYLAKIQLPKGKSIQDFKWLNTLFKEGEFSFTMFFIPAVEHSICPDFYSVAKDTRRKNMFLAIDRLRNPDSSFNALRYFSRFSMVGKIDMSSLWTDYVAMAEEPGRKIDHAQALVSQVKKKDYRYFYRYTDAKGSDFDVIEMDDRVYAVTDLFGKPEFYNHRDPHLFRYFRARK